MQHHCSTEDMDFRRAFEACEVAPADFDHRAHVRLAYIYLCEGGVDQAEGNMARAIQSLLEHNDIDRAKFHVTLTRAWVMAVNHFMDQGDAACASADEFIDANPELLDTKIMLTHYSAQVLFSEDARHAFVEPDIQSIPPPGGGGISTAAC